MEKETIRETVLKAYNFRHACKLFEAGKKISEEDMAYILETGRLSPTSFGMQGVRMLVVTDEALKAKLKPACWNQNQIDSCSHLVVFTTRTADLVPGSDWVKSRFADRGMPADAQEAYYERYAGFHRDLGERIEGFFKRSFVNLFLQYVPPRTQCQGDLPLGCQAVLYPARKHDDSRGDDRDRLLPYGRL